MGQVIEAPREVSIVREELTDRPRVPSAADIIRPFLPRN